MLVTNSIWYLSSAPLLQFGDTERYRPWLHLVSHKLRAGNILILGYEPRVFLLEHMFSMNLKGQWESVGNFQASVTERLVHDRFHNLRYLNSSLMLLGELPSYRRSYLGYLSTPICCLYFNFYVQFSRWYPWYPTKPISVFKNAMRATDPMIRSSNGAQQYLS